MIRKANLTLKLQKKILKIIHKLCKRKLFNLRPYLYVRILHNYRKAKPGLSNQDLCRQIESEEQRSLQREVGCRPWPQTTLILHHLFFQLELSKRDLPVSKSTTTTLIIWEHVIIQDFSLMSIDLITYCSHNGIPCDQSKNVCTGYYARTFIFKKALHSVQEVKSSYCLIWNSFLFRLFARAR